MLHKREDSVAHAAMCRTVLHMRQCIAVHHKHDMSVAHAAMCSRGRGLVTELLGGAAKISEVWEGVVRSSKTCAAFSGIFSGKFFPVIF